MKSLHVYVRILIISAGLPISENPLISKTATHVTLMWSPPFLWPGQRIQRYNITVTNKNTGNSSHHILNSSLIDPIISFSMSISYLQLSTMTCTEVIFSISPVSESAPKVMQTVNVSDWILIQVLLYIDSNYYNQCVGVSKATFVDLQIRFRAEINFMFSQPKL